MMLFQRRPSWLHYRSLCARRDKISLRLILTLPFVLLTVGSTGLVGYLSWQNGQQSINDLANQLMLEVGRRVDQYLQNYLETPHRINRLNASAIQLNQINLENPNQLKRHFLQQIQIFNTVNRIYFSNPQGGLVSVSGNDERGLTIAQTDNFTKGTLQAYGVNQRGDRTQEFLKQPDYDARTRPFYWSAIKAGKPTWSSIYVYVPASRGLGIAASYPVYDQTNQLQGVLSSDLSLTEISSFLQRLKPSPQGKVWIVEQSGLIVASSTPEQPFMIKADQKGERLPATQSKEAVVSRASEYLSSHIRNFNPNQRAINLNTHIDGVPYFLNVVPFEDKLGLNWWLVIAVPESDFKEQINANTRTTLWLSVGALMGAIAISSWLAQGIYGPIRRLVEASAALAKGDWDKVIQSESAIAEFQVLNSHFSQMAGHLQRAFDQVKADLQDSEEKFTKIFQMCPDPIAIATPEGKYVEVNEAFLNLFGYSREEVVGHSATELEHWMTVEERNYYWQAVHSFSPIRNQEFVFWRKNGELITTLLSAEQIEIQGQPYTLEIVKEISDRKQIEAALQQSEARFREIAQTVSQFFFVRSAATGQYIYVSPAYERIWGRSCESLYRDPHSWIEAIHPDDRLWVTQSLAQQFAGNSVQREYRIIQPNGEIRWVFAQINLVRDEAGEPLRFIGLVADISDRKRLEEALQHSEAKLRNVLNSAIASITSLRLFPDGRCEYEYWSEGCEVVFGYTAQELMADPNLWRSRVFPEDREHVLEFNPQKYMVEGTLEEEYRFYHKDGSLRWISDRITSQQDESGDFWLITAVEIDITQQKQSEEALRRAQQVAHVGSWELDIQTQQVKWSQESFHIFGWDAAQPEPTLSQFFELVHPGDRAPLRHSIEQTIATQVPYKVEFRIVQPNGTMRHVEARGEAITDNQGQVIQLLGTNLDITDRALTEEALRQSEARFQKIAAVSPAQIYILVYDPDSDQMRFEYVSPGIREIQELEPEKVLDDALLTYNQVHPDDREAYNRVASKSLKTLEPFSHEWRIITPSGKIKWVRANSRPERWESGEIAWYGVLLDITDYKLAEEALRQSEATKNQILKAIPDLILWMTADGTCIDLIDGSSVTNLYAKSAARGKNLYDLLPSELAQMRMNAIQKALQTGEVQVYEQQISLPTTIRYEEVRVVSVGHDRVLVIVRDITDRKQAEFELEAQRAFFRQVIDVIPSPVFVKDAEGRFIVANQAIAEIHGISVDEMLGKREIDFNPHFNPNQVKEYLANNREVMITRQPKQNLPHQIPTHTGKMRWYQTLLSPFIDGNGQIRGVVGTSVDITELKKIEENLQRQNQALRENEERFRGAFHNAPIGMALIGLDDRWLRVNPMLCDMLGYPEPELLAISASALVHPQDIDKLQQCVERVLSNESRTDQVELRYCCQDGRIVWGMVNLSLVRNSQGQPFYYVAQIQDITERQAIDRMKNEFISIVSHELRTPLTAIQGSLGLLETGIYDNRPEKAKRMIAIALSNSDRLVRLVNDILDLERLSSGKIQLVMEVCNADDLMRRAVEGVQAIADQQSITLTLIPSHLQVWAAPDSIIQTLTNLLSNAIKFSPAKGTVILSAQPQADYVLFHVKDQGRGIPVDKLATIFGRFQQVDVSDSRQKGGTGLGLAICQNIVQHHGGSIWAESTLGEGSIFYFTLPMPPSEAPYPNP